MNRFAANEIQVLVSTTVIEVGINVPKCHSDDGGKMLNALVLRSCISLWTCGAR